MYIFPLLVIFAATALGAPTTPVPLILNLATFTGTEAAVDQGDGFYSAFFNSSGMAIVEFTPLNKLSALLSADDDLLQTRDPGAGLQKRDTFCSSRRSIDTPLLDQANRQLATNAARQGHYNAGAWGWVHLGGETSYFCNHAYNFLTYNLIIDMQVVVSRYCGGSHIYGIDRRNNCCGANNLHVGRTWRGDGFCDGRVHG